MKSAGMKILSASGVLVLAAISCSKPQELSSALLSLLGPEPGNGNDGKSLPIIAPGISIDIDGDGENDISFLDSTGSGSADSITALQTGYPQWVFSSDGSIDTDGDGDADYYFCVEGTDYRIMTGPDCTGSAIQLIDSGDGYFDGIDSNLDGIIDDHSLAHIQVDSTAPEVSLSGSGPGSYASAQSVIIQCTDNIAASNISFTTDNTDPNFTGNGTVTIPPSTSLNIGTAGDGTYYLKYICRDAAGNSSPVQTAVYTIDSQVPNITFNASCTSYVSAGDVTCKWQSDRSANARIIKNGGTADDCSDGSPVTGTQISGPVPANTEITTTISTASLESGLNSVRFCVPNSAGLYAIATQEIIKDSEVPATVIDAPSGPGPFPGGTSLTLSCSDSGESGCLAIAYTFYGSDPEFSGTALTNGSSYANSVALPDGSYTIKARSVDRAGNSSPVVTRSVYIGAPPAPTNLSATASNGQVTLGWDSVDNATGYTVYYATASGVDTSDSSQASASNFATITGLTNGITYYFVVTATHAGGTSPVSTEASALPSAGPPPLFFSEYVEGTANNKALEIFNPGAGTLDMTGCSIHAYMSGAATASFSFSLTNSINSMDTYVLCHSSASATLSTYCDAFTSTVMNFNGDDALELECAGQTLDVIGQIGLDPGNAWSAFLAGLSTQDRTIRRKCAVSSGDSNGADLFDITVQWDPYSIDTFADLGSHTTCY